jgi:hypothetical protein
VNEQAYVKATVLDIKPYNSVKWERKVAEEIADAVFREDDYKYQAINGV